jgi:hypothetical protein
MTEIFALDASALSPATPTEFFSLDSDAPPAPTVPVKTTSVPQSAQPVEDVISLDSLDADTVPVPAAAAKPQSAEAPIPIEEVFSLDADDAPAPVSAAKPQSAGAPIPIEEVFSLDEVEALAQESAAQPQSPEAPIPIEEVFSLDEVESATPAHDAAAPAKPMTPNALKPTSGTVPQPTTKAPSPAKPTSGNIAQPAAMPQLSGTSEALSSTESANGTTQANGKRRPAVKITLVKPGEKSPFAK